MHNPDTENPWPTQRGERLFDPTEEWLAPDERGEAGMSAFGIMLALLIGVGIDELIRLVVFAWHVWGTGK